MDLLEDNKIIDLFFDRSEQAIVELSIKYGNLCKKISENILNNFADAEECVNDTYLAVWNNIPPSRPNPLKAYVCRIISIAKYHSNTAQKRNSHYDVALDEIADCIASTSNVEDETAAKELSLLFDRFLKELSIENRVIFMRRYWFSDTISDIADRVKLSNNTVTVRLSRIRAKLKKYLKKEGYDI